MKKEGGKVARLSIPKSGPPAEKRDRGLYPVFLGEEEEEMLFPPLLSPSFLVAAETEVRSVQSLKFLERGDGKGGRIE